MLSLATDRAVIDRPTFDGQRQRDALTAAQKRSGRDATDVAHEVGLSYPQYNRYLWGRLPLRTDQIAAFAAAYRITKAELSRALGLMDDEDLAALRERAIAVLGPENAAVADDVARGLLGHTDDVRDAALASMQDVLGRLAKGDPE